VTGIAVVTDLVSKWLAWTTDGSVPLVSPTTNEELALGVASFDVGLGWLLLIGGLALALLGHAAVLSQRSTLAAVGFGLLFGGILGNLIDRLATGGVHDWLDLGLAIANLADFYIVFGLGWYVVAAWNAVGD